MRGTVRYARPLRLFLLFLLTGFLIFGISIRNPFAQRSDRGDDYKIGAEDILHISVWGNEQLTRDVIVRPDGKISFPLVNDLKVDGLTAMELREILTQKLAQYLSEPEVTVIINSINNYKVYMMGAVASPGEFSLKRKTNLLQLLSKAGGSNFAERADLKRAYLLRGSSRLPLNFEKLIEDGDAAHNIELQADDIIYIPDNFAKRITVVGEVKTPKTIDFKKGMTALDALLTADGPTESADLNDTKIVREKGEGEEILKVRLKDVMKKGKIENNVKLEPGDVMVIPDGFF